MKDRYKLVIARPEAEAPPVAELCDIREDRGEKTDLAAEDPEIVEAMWSEALV